MYMCVQHLVTATDVKWITQWLQEVLGKVKVHSTIYCDNQSTIHLLNKDDHHSSTKHIDIKLHFIRDYVNSGLMVVKWCCTDQQIADILTKQLSTQRHKQLTDMTLKLIKQMCGIAICLGGVLEYCNSY